MISFLNESVLYLFFQMYSINFSVKCFEDVFFEGWGVGFGLDIEGKVEYQEGVNDNIKLGEGVIKGI